MNWRHGYCLWIVWGSFFSESVEEEQKLDILKRMPYGLREGI